MSMYVSAEKINTDLQQLFNSLPIEQFTQEQRKRIINILIRFGAVAKFRCRSNVAYENFVNACFKNVASFHKEAQGEYEILAVDELVKT